MKNKNIQVLKSYFRNENNDEYIVVELLTEEGIVSKFVKIEDVLDKLVTFPQKSLSEKVLIEKAKELILEE